MAVGALSQAALKRKPETAIVAVISHFIMDNPRLWHAPYPWPEGSPAILWFLPYPHNPASSLVAALLIALTIVLVLLFWRYWWGMIWAISPDVLDWLILRPMIGHGVLHNWVFSWLSTPWGFALELSLFASIIIGLWRGAK